MALVPALLLALLYTGVCALAQSSFTNPPELGNAVADPSTNPVYKVGDVLNIAWTTTDEVVTLIINQDTSSLTQIDYLPNSIALTQHSYNWKITIDGSDTGSTFDLLKDNKFNFMLFTVNETAPSATSTYFNITNSTVDQYGDIIPPSTSTILFTSTLSSTTDISSSTITGLVPATSATTSPTSDSEQGGLNQTTKVGLGVGLGLGGLLFVVIGVTYVFLRRRGTGQKTKNNEPVPQDGEIQHKYAQENWHPPSELHATPRPVPQVSELP